MTATTLTRQTDGYRQLDLRSSIPFTDTDSRTMLQTAVLMLAISRGAGIADVGEHLSALTSLLAEAEAWLPELVADARDLSYTWSQIADRLMTTVPAARHRYAAYAIWRRNHPEPIP